MNASPATSGRRKTARLHATPERLRSAMVSRESISAAIFLATACYITHFLHLTSVGLYEDDFGFISPTFNETWAGFGHALVTDLTTWPQGRPLSWAAASLFGFLGYHAGGLVFLHLLGFFILTANAFLCYKLLRGRLPAQHAAFGALVFCAYPADTSQLFVVNFFFVHLAMTALLAALLAYRRDRRILSYVLAAAAFLWYEMMFIPFFAAPLLTRGRGASFWRRIRTHGAILACFLVVALFLRQHLGDSRVEELNGHLGATLAKIIASLWIGPYTVLKLAVLRTANLAGHLDVEILLVMAVSAGLAALYWGMSPREAQEEGCERYALRTRFVSLSTQLDVARPLPQILSSGLTGVVFLILGYALVFRDSYFPPTWEYGRFSIVHLAGSFGGAMVAGALSWLAVFLAQSYGKRMIAVAVLALYIGTLVAFHFTVQREFAEAWNIERRFWAGVIRTCPDLQDGTIIFHEQQYNYITYALANAWSDAVILPQLLHFPTTWQKVPRVFSVPLNWKDQVEQDGTGLKWLVPAAQWAPHWEPLDPSNVILLRQTGPGRFERLTGSVQIKGKEYRLKQPQPAARAFPHEPLFHYLAE